jgi:predicted DCC family thiol-disulfide oxidoreductase YuxK
MAQQRLYVLDERGVMVSGMEALLIIWSSLPRRRWFGWLLTLPPLRPLANAMYDLVLAPLMHRWNQRRRSLAAFAARNL